MNQTREAAGIFEKLADTISDMMQTIFLFVLKPFEALAQNWGERCKNRWISFSFFIIMVLIYLQHTNISDLILQILPLPSIVRYVFFDLLGCVCMAIVAVCSIRVPLKRHRCNASLTLLWTGFCVFFLISALYTSLDYAGLTIIFAFVFPCIYFIWNSRGDYGTLFAAFMQGAFAFNIVFFIGSVLLSPVGSGQYHGLFTNANSLGQYLTLIMPLFLFQYSLVMHEKSLKAKIKPLIGIGTMAAFIIFSASRTALLSNIIIFLLWLALKLILENKEQGAKKMLKILAGRVLPIFLAIVVCLPITFGLIKGCTTVVYTTLANLNLLPEEFQYLNPSLAGQLDVLAHRMETDGKDADQLSTHRTLIWKAFLARIKPLGHERGKIYVHNYGVAGTTHNCFIQIAYDSGIGTVIFYFAINVLTGLRAFWYYLCRRKYDKYAIFPVLMMPGFLATSLLASSYPPFAYGIAAAYWLVQAPLFMKNVADKKLKVLK